MTFVGSHEFFCSNFRLLMQVSEAEALVKFMIQSTLILMIISLLRSITLITIFHPIQNTLGRMITRYNDYR